ncbi:MAG: hypothetical protein ACRELA_03120, partial [Candidatus Rokuibacteriota bacterium]
MRFEIRRVQRLDGRGDPPVQEIPPRRKEPLVDRVPHVIVHQAKAAGGRLEHAPPNQLLHPGGRLVLADPRRLREQIELDLAPDDRGQRRQPAPALGQALDPASDQLADALRQWQSARRCRACPLLERAHRLHDDERIAFAHYPDPGVDGARALATGG